MDRPYKIELLSSSFNQMFGLEVKKFYIIFEPHKIQCGPHIINKLVAIEREIRNMFGEVIKRASEGHQDCDRVCVVLSHQDLREDIIITLRPLGTITAETILNYTEDECLDGSKPFKICFTILLQ